MKADFKRLGKGTLIYGLGGVLSRFIGFLLLPVFTAYLTPAEYGIAAILSLITMLITPVFSLGFSASMAPCYFEGNDARKKAATIWTAFSILLASVALLAVAGAVLPGRMSLLAFRTPDYARLVTLTLAGACCTILCDPLNLYLRFEERARAVVVLSLISALASIGVSVWLVVGLRMGISGWVIGGLVGQAFTLVLFLVPVVRSVPFRFDRKIGAELLRVGMPLVPAFFFVFVLQQSNKYVLQWFRGLDTVGVYNIGFNLGMAMSMAVTAFQSAWLPFFMSFNDRKEEARILFGRVLTYYVFGFGFLSLLFFIGAKPVVMIMTQPAFHEAYKVVGLTAASEFLRGLFLILLPAMYFAKEVPYQAVVQFLAAGVALLANTLLIPVFGLSGAGVALVCGFLAQVVFMQVWNRLRRATYMDVRYEPSRLLRVSIVFGAIALVTLIPRHSTASIEIFWSVIWIVVLAGALYGLLTGGERAQLWSIIRRAQFPRPADQERKG